MSLLTCAIYSGSPVLILLCDLHLSGHSHLYERYTRTVNGKQIAYVVAGMGGFYNLAGLKPKPPAAPQVPASGTDASGNPLSIQVYNDKAFGFVRITVSATAINGEFLTVDPTTRKTASGDTFSIDLKAGKVSGAAGAGKGGNAGKGGKPGKSGKKPAAKHR